MNMGALSGLHTLSCVVRTKTSQQRFQSILRIERTISLFKEAQLVSGEAGLRDMSVWQGLWANHSPAPLRCTLSCRSQGPMPKSTASHWVSLPMRGFEASPRIMETEPVGPVTSQRLYCLTDYMTLDIKIQTLCWDVWLLTTFKKLKLSLCPHLSEVIRKLKSSSFGLSRKFKPPQYRATWANPHSGSTP